MATESEWRSAARDSSRARAGRRSHTRIAGWLQRGAHHGEEGQPLLHLILSIITAGLWLIVWLLLVIKNKRQRIVLFVSEEGVVETTVTQVGIAG